ncbi:hypothetical protein PRUPE_1G081100 [Prunus persica]|uniref:Uncharacterized protein n=1 Tax=Prunus persica TaxID=3760 RepID=A0A251QU91_PRUPE|nr:hypothetical protein PRUPE_1G081100 [Prunus persica]
MAMEIVNSNCSPTPGALGFFIRCLGSVELVQEAKGLFGIQLESNFLNSKTKFESKTKETYLVVLFLKTQTRTTKKHPNY